MLAPPDDADKAPKITLNECNFGLFPMVNDQKLRQRQSLSEESAPLVAREKKKKKKKIAAGKALDADEALKLGLR